MLKNSVKALLLVVCIYMLFGPLFSDFKQQKEVSAIDFAQKKEKKWEADYYRSVQTNALDLLDPAPNPYAYLHGCMQSRKEVKSFGDLRQVYRSFVDHFRLQIIKNPSDIETNRRYLTVLCSEIEELLDVLKNEGNLDREVIHQSLYNAVEALNSGRYTDLLSELYLVNLQLQNTDNQPKALLTGKNLP